MAIGTLTIEERDGDQDRSEARRTTTYTVLVTLIAAVIAAASGVGGVLVGALASADRDDARSDREFLRTQKIAVYSDFVATAEQLEQQAGPYLMSYENGLPVTPYDSRVPGAGEAQAMRELLDELDVLEARIQILNVDGTVARPAAEMVTATEDGFAFLRLAEKCHVDFYADERCGERPPPRWPDSTDGSDVPGDDDVGVREVPQADSGPGQPPGAPRDNPWGYLGWSASKNVLMDAVREDLGIVP